MENTQEWLASLREGDKVVVVNGERDFRIHVVESTTKNDRYRQGSEIFPQAWISGEGRSFLPRTESWAAPW